MDKKYLATLITACLGVGCIYYFMAVVYKGDQYRAIGGAIVMLFEIVSILIAGLILINSPKTKAIGQGILLGGLITAVIGFGVCSSV